MGIFLLVHFFLFIALVAGQDGCTVTRCRDDGPAIRFPFWLKDRQPRHCGYPGFDLTCTQNNDTLLHLPFSVKVSVKKINYKSQSIHVHYTDGSLPRRRPTLNLHPSVFHSPQPKDYSLFNCSSTKRSSHFLSPISCLSSPGYDVYAVESDASIYDLPILLCTKIYNFSFVPYQVFDQKKGVQLSWSRPICRNCEATHKYCRLNTNNRTEGETECFDIPTDTSTGASKKVKVAGSLLSWFILFLVIIGLYRFLNSHKIGDQLKIENFLEDYKAFKPTRYSYADIKKITDQFRDKVGQGGYGTVYKGKLSNDVLVAVKVLKNDSKGNGEEFINEVATIGTIHHINVVRLLGYCVDENRRALVYEFMPNNSLEKFAFSNKYHKNHFIGWKKLHHIALGIARGIEYLHQGCAQRILHFDIKPHNILLDRNFNPKISDFGLAKLCSKEKSVTSMTTARGTMGYIAPEVFSRNFGNVSSKSDVYSFGMLLLEMVGARNKIDVGHEDNSQAYFPSWIYDHLDRKGDFLIQIEEEGDAIISKKLVIVGLWCILWHPIDRPSIKVVIQMLEGEDTPTMPPKPFASSNLTDTHGRSFNKELKVISESE